MLHPCASEDVVGVLPQPFDTSRRETRQIVTNDSARLMG